MLYVHFSICYHCVYFKKYWIMVSFGSHKVPFGPQACELCMLINMRETHWAPSQVESCMNQNKCYTKLVVAQSFFSVLGRDTEHAVVLWSVSGLYISLKLSVTVSKRRLESMCYAPIYAVQWQLIWMSSVICLAWTRVDHYLTLVNKHLLGMGIELNIIGV